LPHSPHHSSGASSLSNLSRFTVSDSESDDDGPDIVWQCWSPQQSPSKQHMLSNKTATVVTDGDGKKCNKSVNKICDDDDDDDDDNDDAGADDTGTGKSASKIHALSDKTNAVVSNGSGKKRKKSVKPVIYESDDADEGDDASCQKSASKRRRRAVSRAVFGEKPLRTLSAALKSNKHGSNKKTVDEWTGGFVFDCL